MISEMKPNQTMLKKFLFSGLLFTLALSLSAQPNQYTAAEDSDPEARAILEQVKDRYEAYTSMEATFNLAIEFPEQPVENQQGTIARNGEQYRVRLGTQEAFSDGRALYVVLHDNQSVQINDLPDPSEDMGMLTPESIFSFYESDMFVYSLMDTRSEGSRVVHIIEFKPTDRSSEYAKIRMLVNRANNEIVEVKAFAKDGSRYTITLSNFNGNKQFASGHFAYSETKYPGYYVEDLRE